MLYSTEMGESERYKWKEDRCTEGSLAKKSNGHNTIKVLQTRVSIIIFNWQTQTFSTRTEKVKSTRTVRRKVAHKMIPQKLREFLSDRGGRLVQVMAGREFQSRGI